MSIRDEIVGRRRRRIRAEGHALGVPVPTSRQVPLVPLDRDPLLICEVKRRSPSRGWIARDLDAADMAFGYVDRGARGLSVLTEEDHFGGSLHDLLRIKRAHPEVAVLRKDFLLDEEDVEVSWKAGADAILLIASILDVERLGLLSRKARELGMQVLTELHDQLDARKARGLKPELVGINSRNLGTFAVDALHPIGLRSLVDWKARCVFESGIRCREDARVALASGFDGLLVGESVARDADVIPELLEAFAEEKNPFWRRLAERRTADRPLVKICGLCREEDARMAADLGADVLGFIFAPSPRRARPDLPKRLASLDVLKVAVAVGSPRSSRGSPGAEGSGLAPEVGRLLDDGYIDAVQFHGEERPEECCTMAFPYYKALRIKDRDDLERAKLYRSPRVLLDAFSARVYGGTGKRISDAALSGYAGGAGENGLPPLWLAGGLGPENVRSAVETYRPELVDASSGLESAPGVKDRERVEKYFREVEHAGS